MFKDPICGMDVKNEHFAFEIAGKKYFFCSQGCLEEFKKPSDEGSGKLGVHDLVIIGAGPAGLSAAVKSSILKIDTLLIAKDIGGESQFLREHYLEHRIDEVVRIKRKGGIFELWTKEGSSITAYAIIIATGLKQPPGLEVADDKGIFACKDEDEGPRVASSAKKYLEDLGIK